MSYYDQLHPWVVYRLLPNFQTIAVARFRRRNDAEMYLIAVRQLVRQARWAIREAIPTGTAFDPALISTPDAEGRSLDFLKTSPKGEERQRNQLDVLVCKGQPDDSNGEQRGMKQVR